MMTRTIFVGLLIIMLSLSVIANPLAVSAQTPNEKSNEKSQMVSAMGKIPGKDLAVHMWVLVQHGADKDDVVRQALAKHGAQHFVSEKFSTNGVYWDQFGDGPLGNDFVTQKYNPQNDPSGGVGLSALLNTHTKWNSVATSSFAFDYGGQTTRCPSLVDECPGGQFFDGNNDVAWVDLAGSNILGVTWYGLSTDEADMALNTDFTWATDGTNHYDIETVMLHENGHVLGLGHSSYSQAVMYSSYHGVLRVLHSDDIAGVSSLYPGSEPVNLPPLANAGPNQTVNDSNNDGSEGVTLDGSGSSDSDGTITSYVWTNSNNAVIGNTVSITPTVPLGTNVYTLTVTDDDGDTNTDTVSVTVQDISPPNIATVAVLDSVEILNNDYSLSWTLPPSAYGSPDGGYDIFIDGVDTGTTHRTVDTTATISGLDTSLNHCFKVQVRWTEIPDDPNKWARSNEVCVGGSGPNYGTVAVLDSVETLNNDYVLSWTLPPSAYGSPDGGYDIFIDGVDTGTIHRTVDTTATISGLDTSLQHCFKVQVRWTEIPDDPNRWARSNEVCVG